MPRRALKSHLVGRVTAWFRMVWCRRVISRVTPILPSWLDGGGFPPTKTKGCNHEGPANHDVFATPLRPLFGTGRVSDQQRGGIRHKRRHDRRRSPRRAVQPGRSLRTCIGCGRQGGDRIRQGTYQCVAGPLIAAELRPCKTTGCNSVKS